MSPDSREDRAFRMLLRESIWLKFKESHQEPGVILMVFDNGVLKFSVKAPSFRELLLRVGHQLQADAAHKRLGDTVVQILEEPEA
jgi:hypothetical protein